MATATKYAMERVGDFEIWIKPYRMPGEWDEWDVKLANTPKVIGKVIQRAAGGYLASLPWQRSFFDSGRKEWTTHKGMATGKGDTIAEALKVAKVAADEAQKA